MAILEASVRAATGGAEEEEESALGGSPPAGGSGRMRPAGAHYLDLIEHPFRAGESEI